MWEQGQLLAGRPAGQSLLFEAPRVCCRVNEEKGAARGLVPKKNTIRVGQTMSILEGRPPLDQHCLC